jgi:hypothetical protein
VVLRTRSKPALSVIACVCTIAVAGCGSGHPLAGAHLVDVVSAVPGEQPVAAIAIARQAEIRHLAGWIDRLRPVPKGIFNCPAFTAVEPTVTLRFLARANGRVLATATETDYGFGSSICNPLTLAVRGQKTRHLIGGRFLEQLQRLLGANLGFGTGTIKGGISLAGGPAASKTRPIAGRVQLSLALTRLQPRSERISVEMIPRDGQHFDFVEGPGVYTLRATSPNGQPSGCPPTTVTLRAGETLHVSVPWGCAVK